MCGRFTLSYTFEELMAFAPGAEAGLRDWTPRYNVAPTQEHPILRMAGEEREWLWASWGLVNEWAADASRASRTINARAETISERPTFRQAFAERRCVVPADGFYEWQRTGDHRRPYLIHRQDGAALLMAGLYEVWKPRNESPRVTFTIVTTRANADIARLHDRMPVVLEDEQADEWMFARTGERRLRQLMEPASAGVLTTRPVSHLVNAVANEGAALVERAAEQVRLF